MFFLLTLLTSLAHAAPDLRCKAIYRTLDAQNRAVEKEADMPVTFAMGKVKKLGVDLEGRYFSVTAEDATLLGQITQAPDYTKGIVSRGLFDANGAFNLSQVDGVTVFRIECLR